MTRVFNIVELKCVLTESFIWHRSHLQVILFHLVGQLPLNLPGLRSVLLEGHCEKVLVCDVDRLVLFLLAQNKSTWLLLDGITVNIAKFLAQQ